MPVCFIHDLMRENKYPRKINLTKISSFLRALSRNPYDLSSRTDHITKNITPKLTGRFGAQRKIRPVQRLVSRFLPLCDQTCNFFVFTHGANVRASFISHGINRCMPMMTLLTLPINIFL